MEETVLLLPQGTGFSVANDEAGWSTLIGRLRGLLLTAIGLEPSGGYERGVLRALLAAGLSVRRINPNTLRQFARARGALADPGGGRVMAHDAEIGTMRRQLCDEHVAIENQAAQLEDAMLRRLAKRRLARIETDIRLLDKRLTQMIAAGHFPLAGQRSDHADSPRVGDGFIRLDEAGRVVYASPNGLSAYRRLGLQGDLAGLVLTDLTRDLVPARKRLDEETLSAVLGGRDGRAAGTYELRRGGRDATGGRIVLGVKRERGQAKVALIAAEPN